MQLRLKNKGERITYGFHEPKLCVHEHPLGLWLYNVLMFDGVRYGVIIHSSHPHPRVSDFSEWSLYEYVQFPDDKEYHDMMSRLHS